MSGSQWVRHAMYADVTEPGKGLGYGKTPDGGVDFLFHLRDGVWHVYESVTDDPYTVDADLTAALKRFAARTGVTGRGQLTFEYRRHDGPQIEVFDLEER